MAQKIYEEKYYKARKLDQVKNDKVALSIFDFSSEIF
ncbi:glycosyl hydrolase 108 family protein [Klebsiella pneumoniae]